MEKWYKIIIFISISLSSFGQDIDIVSTVDNSVTVCSSPSRFTVVYTNNTSATLFDPEIKITFPYGVSYVISSLNEITTNNIQEKNIDNLNQPLFSTDNLEPGEHGEFTISFTALPLSIDHQQAGNVFRNDVLLTHNSGIKEHTSNSYNLLYPALTVTNVTPSSQQIESGTTTFRTISVINLGNGRLEQFHLTDLHDNTKIAITEADLGFLSVNGDTITLTGSDFSTIGNGDGYFDTNESITITQEIEVIGCSSSTISSTIESLWGCNGEIKKSDPTYGHITIQAEQPNLKISSTQSLSSCFATEKSPQQIILANIGQGGASSVIIDVFRGSVEGFEYNYLSAIDENSFTYQIGENGSPIEITPVSTVTGSNSGVFSCLGDNPVKELKIELPVNIQPQDTIIINWSMYHCCINTCENPVLKGWSFTVGYNDMCGEDMGNTIHSGQKRGGTTLKTFIESPSDIHDGEKLPFYYNISTFKKDYPNDPEAHYEVVIQMDEGLEWSGDYSDVVWRNESDVWAIDSLIYNESNRQLSIVYKESDRIAISGSEIRLNLIGNCDNGNISGGMKTVTLSINYISNPSCNVCKSSLVCDEPSLVDLHCPSSSCVGFNFIGMDLERTNYGKPDNNSDGVADESGELNMDEIRLRRFTVGDTLQTTYQVYVSSSSEKEYFENFFLEASMTLGENLTFLTGEIVIYDDSTEAYYNCNDFSIDVIDENEGIRTFRYSYLPNQSTDVLPNTIGAEFYFNEGDSLTFIVRYQVTGNIQKNIIEGAVTNDLFSSSFSDPWLQDSISLNNDKWGCNRYGGKFTLIGHSLEVYNKDFNINTCSQELSQRLMFYVGDKVSGVSLFPFEHRNLMSVSKTWMKLPSYYKIKNIRAFFGGNSGDVTSTSVDSITDYSIINDTLFIEIENLYKSFGGEVEQRDEGYQALIYVEIEPTCETPSDFEDYIERPVEVEFHQNLGDEKKEWKQPSPHKVVYFQPKLSLLASNPILDGIERTVNWNFNISNSSTTSSAQNSWVYFESLSGDVSVDYLIDNDSHDTLVLNGDYFSIGNISPTKSKSYTAVASYTACSPDSIVVHTGFSCSGYPESFTDFDCSYDKVNLYVNPKTAEMQVTMLGATIDNYCDNIVEIDLEIASVRLGYVDSVEVDILPIGNSVAFSSGTGELNYPIANGFESIVDPMGTPSGYQYKLMEINNDLRNDALPGESDLMKNRMLLKVKLNVEDYFMPGDYVNFLVRSKSVCGQELPSINLAYDPAIEVDEANLSGLSLDTSNTWSVSWGDYNNDGFEDVFITDYNSDSSNHLYENQGDGTFQQNTSGVMGMSGGSSIASTWGDYDNDGDLDLFVANNIGHPNVLYTNQGDGTFEASGPGHTLSFNSYCHGASWVDYDNDGFLDLFVTDYMPTKFNLLYHNDGDGTFTQITTSALVLEAAYSIGAVWADYDNDGDQDVFIPSDRGANNLLFNNNGQGSFTKITTGNVVNDGGNSVGASWGDYNNDGYLDLFVANASGQNNFLYQNNGDGSFMKITSGSVVNDGGNSHGSSWADTDNDGDLDLFVTNDQDDPNFFYTNNGSGVFTKDDNPLNNNHGNSFGSAWADYDNDGDLDLFVANHSDETNTFITNTKASCNSWACVRLTGTTSNSSAIGAVVKVKAIIDGEEVWQKRELSGQTGGGAGGQNSLRAMFGLKDATSIDSIVVVWPSGMRQYMVNQLIDGCIDVIEPVGNLIQGYVYIDENNNCIKDAGEQSLYGEIVEIQPGDYYITTDVNGQYEIYLPQGDYELTHSLGTEWTTSCSDESSSLQITGDLSNVNCARVPACQSADLKASLGVSAMRRGFINTIALLYENNSAYAANNVTLKLELDDELELKESTLDWDDVEVTDSTLIYSWDIGTVEAFEKISIQLKDSVMLSTQNGDMLYSKVYFEYSGIDCEPSNNEQVMYHEVVGAVDPNDKLVFPIGIGPTHAIASDQELIYTIRFQNVGTYYASRVIVVDTLSDHLDLSTFQVRATSHRFSYQLNGNILTWTATGIYLPDSVANEPESHGFVQFSILPKKRIDDNSVIYNSAAIQFDYNEYIITNVVYSTINDNLNNLNSKVYSITAFPNPASEIVTVRLDENRDMLFLPTVRSLQVISMEGKVVIENQYSNRSSVQVDVSRLPSGLHTIKAYDEYGNIYLGKLTVISF